jgi:hypothetical protein
MKLVTNWCDVLKRAWSVRLMILAMILSGLEVGLQFVSLPIPTGLSAAVAGLVTALAFGARIIAQKGLSE